MPNLVQFDGSNDYLTKSSTLTGFSNGKLLTVAGWLDPDADFRKVFTGFINPWHRVDINLAFGQLDVKVSNSSNTLLLQQQTTSTDMITRGLFHFVVAIDLGNTNSEIYIDGVADGATPTTGPIDDDIDLTLSSWKIGASGSNTQRYSGGMYGLWVDQSEISAAQAASFSVAGPGFVDIGSDGSDVTGVAPDLYFADVYSNFEDNKGGTGSANDFTVTGTLAEGAALPEITVVPHLSFTDTFYVPNIKASVVIDVPHLSFTDTFYVPEGVEDTKVQVPLLTFTDTFYVPDIIADNNVQVPLLVFTGEFHVPVITGAEVVDVPHLAFTDTFNIPVINAAEIVVVPHLSFVDIFHTPTLVEDIKVQVPLLSFSDTFYVPAIIGLDTLEMPLLTFEPTFYVPNPLEGQPIERRQQQPFIGSYIVLFEIDATSIGSGKFYFTQNAYTANPVNWQGNEYVPIDVEADGFETSTGGAFPTPKIRISNVTKIMSSIVIAFNQLVGAKITRWRTLEEFLDDGAFPDPNAHMPPDIYYVDRMTKHNKFLIEWQLTADMDKQGTKLPRRQVLRDVCTFQYRTYNATSGEMEYNGGANQCPYVGNDGDPPATAGPFFDLNGDPTTIELDKCSKKIGSGCKPRFIDATNDVNDPIPGRFFPSVGRNRV